MIVLAHNYQQIVQLLTVRQQLLLSETGVIDQVTDTFVSVDENDIWPRCFSRSMVEIIN